MSSKLTGSVVLITGGTGSFGNAFLDECIAEGAREIRIFSRDEKKQYDMAQRYREQPNVKFFLGDIRDKKSLDTAVYGVDYVFHAAAMKQVPSCERFPMEAVKTNINGSDNVLTTAVQKHVKKVVCLSTDKAVYPTSAMGFTKAYMEKLAMQKAAEQDKTEICVTRFGNLIASRGSAVPLFIDQVKNGAPITITEPDMTRFVMTVQDAVSLVKEAFESGNSGDLFVKKSYACTTGDLASAVCKYMGLPRTYPTVYIGIRPGEKMHEALLTEEEAANAIERGDYILVPRAKSDMNPKIKAAYRSDLSKRLGEDELLALINRVFEEGSGV